MQWIVGFLRPVSYVELLMCWIECKWAQTKTLAHDHYRFGTGKVRRLNLGIRNRLTNLCPIWRLRAASSLTLSSTRSYCRISIFLCHILRQHLHEVQHSLRQTGDRTAELTSRYLSPLVQELGKLQANKILRGDYDLKIARQDYFVSKQDQV